MIDKRTVFVLGAGASCPYGYPSGARLRKRIVMGEEFIYDFQTWQMKSHCTPAYEMQKMSELRNAFEKSHINSIDKFMANNPALAPIGKYIIAFETFRAEHQSFFSEAEKLEQERLASARNSQLGLPQQPLSFGDGWYSYLYNRLLEGMVGKDTLPDFSRGNFAFITFNYDRSLEQFFYESLRHSFTEVPEEKIIDTLKQLKIIHVYGQIAPFKWQNQKNGVGYKPDITGDLLLSTANNIGTIYEEKHNPELAEAQNLLKQAERIFFLGFGYASENMEVLNLIKTVSPAVQIYGTAFNLETNEIRNVHNEIDNSIPPTATGYKHQYNIKIENMDCLKLLRNYL